MNETTSLVEINSKTKNQIWASLAALYLIVRFGFTRQLEAISPYASYAFEILIVSSVIVLSGKHFIKLLKPTMSVIIGAVIGLGFGFAAFKCAGLLGIAVPFNLEGTETLIFLLIIAPILEEFIFRFLLWSPIEFVTKEPSIAWVITSALFSYSHLHAVFSVPAEVHPFIYYQMAYTLVLGYGCGFFVYQKRSVANAIAIHFVFNLGFFLASRV